MFYYIQNTIDERRSKIQGYFATLDRAIDVCKTSCSDWFNEVGTGEIYEVVYGLNVKPRLVWKNGKYIDTPINY